MKYNRIKFYITVISVVVFICDIDSLSFTSLITWLVVNSLLIYDMNKIMSKMSDKEIIDMTGYNRFEKIFGKLDE